MRRRSLLASSGLAAISVSSGCLGALSDPSPKLGWVGFQNWTPARHRFRFQVLRDGDVVHDSTHRIPGDTEDSAAGTVLDCTWGSEPGPYTLRARVVDGGEWVERSVADAVEEDPRMETPDCVVATIEYGMGNSDSFTFRIRDTCEAVRAPRDSVRLDGGCAFANATPTPDS